MAGGVDAHTDEAAWQLALEPCAHGHVAGVRSAEAHRNTETLAGADGDIRSEISGRCDKGESEKIGGNDGEAALRLGRCDDGLRVPDTAMLPVLARADALLDQGHRYKTGGAAMAPSMVSDSTARASNWRMVTP